MKNRFALLLAICLVSGLVPFSGLAAQKKKSPTKAPAQTKAYSVWVNKDLADIRLDQRGGVSVCLTQVAMDQQGGMTVYIRLKGGKFRGSVTMTKVTLGGKAVKEDRKTNIFSGSLSADDGQVGLNISNPTMKTLRFSLEIVPRPRAKKYTIGPFKLQFAGNFTQAAQPVVLSLAALEREEPVLLLEKGGLKLEGLSLRAQTSRNGRDGQGLILSGRLVNHTGKQLFFDVESMTLNETEYFASMNCLGSPSESESEEFFTLTIESFFGEEVPGIGQIASGSFSLRVSSDSEDLFFQTFQLDCASGHAVPEE